MDDGPHGRSSPLQRPEDAEGRSRRSGGKTPRASSPAPRHPSPLGLAALVGDNVKLLRRQRRWSLDQLASASSVSRAMLGQIELGRSVPSIKTLWLIAHAFDVSVSWFLEPRQTASAVVLPVDPLALAPLPAGAGHRRALFVEQGPRYADLHELRLARGATAELPAEDRRALVNVMVVKGALDILIGSWGHRLSWREVVQFEGQDRVLCHNADDGETVAVWVSQPLHPRATVKM